MKTLLITRKQPDPSRDKANLTALRELAEEEMGIDPQDFADAQQEPFENKDLSLVELRRWFEWAEGLAPIADAIVIKDLFDLGKDFRDWMRVMIWANKNNIPIYYYEWRGVKRNDSSKPIVFKELIYTVFEILLDYHTYIISRETKLALAKRKHSAKLDGRPVGIKGRDKKPRKRDGYIRRAAAWKAK